MGLIVFATMLGFVGNGFHCYGSPGGTGDILPRGSDSYITAISVLVARPFNDPVGWEYRSNTGQTYVQIGKGGAILRKNSAAAMQPGWHRLRCELPPHYLTGNDF